MNSKLLGTLTQIKHQFEPANIDWAIGGSLLLKAHQLVEKVNDVDLIIARKDIKQADQILSELGQKLPTKPAQKPFRSKAFHQYQVHDIGVDLMADFTIEHEEGLFIYPFPDQSNLEHRLIDGTSYPCCPLEDWYVLYQLLNREATVKIIEMHFKRQGPFNPCQLQSFLTKPLPQSIKHNIQNLLEFTNT